MHRSTGNSFMQKATATVPIPTQHAAGIALSKAIVTPVSRCRLLLSFLSRLCCAASLLNSHQSRILPLRLHVGDPGGAPGTRQRCWYGSALPRPVVILTEQLIASLIGSPPSLGRHYDTTKFSI
jgi:hypothetical protein